MKFMKKLWLTLALSLSLSLTVPAVVPALNSSASVALVQASKKKEKVVYVTPTGKKYHARKCGNGTYTKSTLTKAKARGLTPCKKCF